MESNSSLYFNLILPVYHRLERLPEWIEIRDPLSEKNYFYHPGTQTCQWMYPGPNGFETAPTSEGSQLAASFGNRKIQKIFDRIGSRHDGVRWSRKRTIEGKDELIIVCSEIYSSGCDISDIVAIFASLVDSLEREREATIIRHLDLAELIRDRLLSIEERIKHHPTIKESLVGDFRIAYDAVDHIIDDIPPPPPPADATALLDVSHVTIDAPDSDSLIGTSAPTRSSPSEKSVPRSTNLDDGGGHGEPSPGSEILAHEVLNNKQLPAEGKPGISRKRKRTSQKDPVQKDPEKFKHKCSTCGERFTRSTTLREHARIHSGERPFECSMCGQGFSRSKDRNRHQKIHTREDKYLCGTTEEFSTVPWGCHQSFAREDQLAAHLRTQRGWGCIVPLLQNQDFRECLMGMAAYNNGYCCQLSSDACWANFNNFEELITHLQDGSNRSCVADFLVKQSLVMSRVGRGVGIDKLGTFYDSEEQNRNFKIHTPDSSQHQNLHHGTTNLRSHTNSVRIAVDRMKSRSQCPFPNCVSKGTIFVWKTRLISHLRDVHDTDPCPFSHCVEELDPRTASTAEHIRISHGSFECALRSCEWSVSHFSEPKFLQHLKHDHRIGGELFLKALTIANTRGNILREEDVAEHEVFECSACGKLRL